VNLVSSFSAAVSPSKKHRGVKLTWGIASLIPWLQPEVPSGQFLPASSDPIFRREFPSQSATVINSSGQNAAFAPIDKASPKLREFLLLCFAFFSLLRY
jgi:hypothetical protein